MGLVEEHKHALRALRGPEGLMQKAIAFLDAKLKDDPHNTSLLQNFSNMLRGRADLDRAASVFRLLTELEKDDPQWARACAIFNGEPLPSSVLEGFQIAPFVRIENFLPEEERQQLLACLVDQRDAFQTSAVAVEDYPNPRSSLVLYEQDLEHVRTFFMDRVQARLADVFPRLGMAPFTPGRVEMQMVSHLDNDYYVVHRDSRNLPGYRDRKLTYVYYFYEDPAVFEDGELLVYDTDEKKDVCSKNFTAIQPKNNSIVFFPSHFYHEVAPVQGAGEDLRYCRNALNGWLHEA